MDTPEDDRAVMLAKPVIPTGVMGASAAPPSITSHRPVAIRRAALPMLWVPAAQAVTVVSHGPRKPERIETVAAPAFPMIMGTRKGVTRRGPFSR